MKFLSCITLITVLATATAFGLDAEIKPFLESHCIKCHGGEKVKGKVDFTKINTTQAEDEDFELWETVVDLLRFDEMPPEDEAQPTDAEREQIYQWYQKRFVTSVEARPGDFSPRRLSATEYRNTLRSLFGFDLEVAVVEAEETIVEKSLVMKLLPTDPRGKSGYTNDTHGNPLTTVIWDQYSYLVDTALNQLLASSDRPHLEALIGPLSGNSFSQTEADKLLRTLLPKIFRRSVGEDELEKHFSPLENLEGKELTAAVKTELKTALMSPQFIYRGLLMRGTPDEQQAVDNFELAERLSYFLWEDMPDEGLMAAAIDGTLSDPIIFRKHIDRMLKSPKSRSLAESFGVQWFSLDEIDHSSNRPVLIHALKTQVTDFLDYLFTGDSPLMELIDSNITFINPHTARFYGKDRSQMARYTKQKGIEQERVSNSKITLVNTKGRGGILTMPGVMAMNNGPVIRGTWMLERILGDELSDPPADVGVVKPSPKGQNLSFRERFEEHRANPSCALCHDKIDPLGFAMQKYDKEGAHMAADGYKPKKNRKSKNTPADELDTSGQLPSGEKFSNFEELKTILTTSQRKVIVRNIVEQMLSYSLCRKLEIYDRPTVESIVEELYNNDGTFRDLIYQITDSLPFREASFKNKDS